MRKHGVKATNRKILVDAVIGENKLLQKERKDRQWYINCASIQSETDLYKNLTELDYFIPKFW